MTPRKILRAFVPVFTVAALFACGTEAPDGEEAGPPADTTGASEPPTAEAVESSPSEADLPDLVNDIREGIAPLAGTVEQAPDTARQRAVRLYVTRQEVIEARWGPRSEGGETPLAVAVVEAEDHFHHLMETLNATPPPDSTTVADAVDSLDSRLAEILRVAEEVGAE